MDTVQLDFSHPWSDFLYLYKVPKEKWDEFYEQFGLYFYSKSTPEQTKNSAWRWIITNGRPSSEVSQ
jgi:hypothetical protein